MFQGTSGLSTWARAGLLANLNELVEGLHVSGSIGSDTVFIALASAHLGEVWIECLLTEAPFSSRIYRVSLLLAQDPEIPPSVFIAIATLSEQSRRDYM